MSPDIRGSGMYVCSALQIDRVRLRCASKRADEEKSDGLGNSPMSHRTSQLQAIAPSTQLRNAARREICLGPQCLSSSRRLEDVGLMFRHCDRLVDATKGVKAGQALADRNSRSLPPQRRAGDEDSNVPIAIPHRKMNAAGVFVAGKFHGFEHAKGYRSLAWVRRCRDTKQK
jgi:hypothetical protein